MVTWGTLLFRSTLIFICTHRIQACAHSSCSPESKMNVSLYIFAVTVISLIVPLRSTSITCLPCKCNRDKMNSGVYAVCSKLNLTSVPLTLPVETTSLLLDGNKFKRLSNYSFNWLGNLKYLDLSRNHLLTLDDDVFSGLDKLESLNMDTNHLGSVHLKYLLPLRSLLKFSCLDQWSHLTQMVYLGDSFPLSLRELYLMCDRCSFSSSFSLLPRLTTLSLFSDDLASDCIIDEITEYTFEYFPHLETLNLSGCRIYSINSEAFQSLKNLKILDMTLYFSDFYTFFNATMSLQYSNIEVIKFTNNFDIEVNKNLFIFLRNTSLRELYLDSDRYALIDRRTLENLPYTLEVLSLKHFQFVTFNIFLELRGFQSLKTIDLSGMILPHRDIGCNLDVVPYNVTTFICIACACENTVEGKSSETKIENLDLRSNYLYSLDLPSQMFSNFIYLNLGKNSLANFFENNYYRFFKNMTKLKYLDISENGIASLPELFFSFFHNIQVINVSNNHLNSVQFKLSESLNLKTIDLSGNKLHDLSLIIRSDLDRLPSASVNLNRNPLICGCEELEFLKWAQMNPHRVEDMSSLICRLSTGQYDTFGNLNRIVGELEDSCKSNVVKISVSVSVAVCVMAALIGFLGYRHRWKLRYLYHVGRRGYRRRYDVNNGNENAYEYDAFVSYADEDRRFVIDSLIPELEDKCGLKLCIHHRDFLPGEVIADNIVNAIQNSRKTLIILSPSFQKSNWCEFEFNMARMEGVSRREEIVLVILYQDVPMKALSKDMALMLRRNCYIEYNNDIFDNEVFWYNVLESIMIMRPID